MVLMNFPESLDFCLRLDFFSIDFLLLGDLIFFVTGILKTSELPRIFLLLIDSDKVGWSLFVDHPKIFCLLVSIESICSTGITAFFDEIDFGIFLRGVLTCFFFLVLMVTLV